MNKSVVDQRQFIETLCNLARSKFDEFRNIRSRLINNAVDDNKQCLLQEKIDSIIEDAEFSSYALRQLNDLLIQRLKVMDELVDHLQRKLVVDIAEYKNNSSSISDDQLNDIRRQITRIVKSVEKLKV